MAKDKQEKPPPGGWMGPPRTTGLKGLREAVGSKKGKWIWKDIPQKAKDRRLRKEWERRMSKADAKGRWHFPWPPKDD